MASEGPNHNDTSADDGSNGGTVSWTNIGNVTGADDGANATASLATGAKTDYAKCSDFDFTTMSDAATGNGIFSEFYKARTVGTGNVTDVNHALVKADDTYASEDKADATTPWTGPGFNWVGAGDATSLWGETWSGLDFKDVNFGNAIAGQRFGIGGTNPTAAVDASRLTAYFTEPGGSGNLLLLNSNGVNGSMGRAPSMSMKNRWPGEYAIDLGNGHFVECRFARVINGKEVKPPLWLPKTFRVWKNQKPQWSFAGM